MEKQLNIKEFVSQQNFSSEIYREIAQTLLMKYKDETARQHLVRALIMIFEKRYPGEVEKHEEAVEQARELQMDKKFASNDQGQRHLFRFPRELWTRLSSLVSDPPFLDTPEEMAWAAKAFPQYLIP